MLAYSRSFQQSLGAQSLSRSLPQRSQPSGRRSDIARERIEAESALPLRNNGTVTTVRPLALIFQAFESYRRSVKIEASLRQEPITEWVAGPGYAWSF